MVSEKLFRVEWGGHGTTRHIGVYTSRYWTLQTNWNKIAIQVISVENAAGHASSIITWTSNVSVKSAVAAIQI